MYTKTEIQRGLGRVIGRTTNVFESITLRSSREPRRYVTAEISEIPGSGLELVAIYDCTGRLTWL